MAELGAGLADLLDGRGGLFLVTGEPGIGKTRLADEFERSAAARGAAVHWGRSWEAGGAPSYWPFVQLLRSLCRGLETEALARLVGSHGPELAELLPDLRHRIPGLAKAPAPSGTDRFQLFDAVGSFLHAVADRTPQVLVLDDLHAADPSSLLLLHFLVRGLRAVPLMMVGTYRDAEARLSPDIGRSLSLLAREACLLPLRRLHASEVADFVAQATGAAPEAERVDALHRRTEGNPLFLHELLQLPGTAVRPPDGIREVVRARLALLTPPARLVLEAAAVLGREFELEPLAAVAETPEAELRGLLAPAADAGIVEPVEPPSRWRFTHVLLREGLYDDLAPDRRASLHRTAARELERRPDPALPSELAHHLLNAIPAVPIGDAADGVLRAAERAMSLLAFEDAATLLGRIARRLEGSAAEEPRRFEALLGLGVARIRAGDVVLGKETCRRAADLARRLGDGERFARAVLGFACEFVPQVRDAVLIALLEEALALVPPGDGPLRARCMAQLAAERQPEPDPEGPIVLAREAVAMARRLGDEDTLRFALSDAGLTMLAYGDPAERQTLDGECLRLALAAGDTLAALRAHLLLASDCWELGEVAGAHAHVEAYEALVRLRHRRYQWVAHLLRATEALWRGQFDDAERGYREAVAIWIEDEGRGPEMLAFPLALCRGAERHDDLPGIESRLRAALSAQPGLGGCVAEMLIAQLHARLGDRRRTETQLAAVRSHPAFAEIREASWLALLAEPCHLLRDTALAARLYAALLPRARRFHWLGPLGSSFEPTYDRPLGLLAWTLGRLDDAVAHLAAAERSAAEAGMRSHLARLRYELAGVLLARRAEGDRDRAAALLAGAHALAEDLGQSALLPLVAARGIEAGPGATGATGGALHATMTEEPFVLRREGDTWAIASGDRNVRLRDSRGLQVLARLIASPGREFHVMQLVSGDDGPHDAGDAGALLDDEAVRSYRERLLALGEELDEAERFADAGRSERAREEIAFLEGELARAVGLGGRARRAGGATERARTTVQKRLREAVRRIEQELPRLGRHLDQTVRTGTFCGYLPEGRPGGRRG